MRIDELYESKCYVKNGITFPHITSYVNPFLEILGDVQVDTQAVEATINGEEDGDLNIAYGRVKIEGKIFPDMGEMESVLGMIVAMDVKPVIKIYTGQNVKACTNLTIFNSEQIFTQDLLQDTARVFDQTKRYLDAKEKENAEYANIISELKNIKLSHKELDEKIGFMLRSVRLPQFQKIGLNVITHAAELIDDKESAYYIPPTDDCSLWKLYNAMTQGITRNKEFLDKPMKTLLATNLLKYSRN